MVGGEQCLTGCVAHAMGEVMKYYRHPERGRGSYSYTDSIGCGLTLTADFHEHVYDWDNILDSYVEGKYTEEQAEKDADRTKELESMNLTVLRICNLDIDRNFRGVCEHIDLTVRNLSLSQPDG